MAVGGAADDNGGCWAVGGGGEDSGGQSHRWSCGVADGARAVSDGQSCWLCDGVGLGALSESGWLRADSDIC